MLSSASNMNGLLDFPSAPSIAESAVAELPLTLPEIDFGQWAMIRGPARQPEALFLEAAAEPGPAGEAVKGEKGPEMDSDPVGETDADRDETRLESDAEIDPQEAAAALREASFESVSAFRLSVPMYGVARRVVALTEESIESFRPGPDTELILPLSFVSPSILAVDINLAEGLTSDPLQAARLRRLIRRGVRSGVFELLADSEMVIPGRQGSPTAAETRMQVERTIATADEGIDSGSHGEMLREAMEDLDLRTGNLAEISSGDSKRALPHGLLAFYTAHVVPFVLRDADANDLSSTYFELLIPRMANDGEQLRVVRTIVEAVERALSGERIARGACAPLFHRRPADFPQSVPPRISPRSRVSAESLKVAAPVRLRDPEELMADLRARGQIL